MDVHTVNLFQKGIHEVSEVDDGHRVYMMIHRESNTAGTGFTRQKAYDDLMEKMNDG